MKVLLKRSGRFPRIPRTKAGVDWTKTSPPKSAIGPKLKSIEIEIEIRAQPVEMEIEIEKPSQTHLTWFCMGEKIYIKKKKNPLPQAI
jgi:hypothetical protein